MRWGLFEVVLQTRRNSVVYRSCLFFYFHLFVPVHFACILEFKLYSIETSIYVSKLWTLTTSNVLVTENIVYCCLSDICVITILRTYAGPRSFIVYNI